jgi:hypothetical protein
MSIRVNRNTEPLTIHFTKEQKSTTEKIESVCEHGKSTTLDIQLPLTVEILDCSEEQDGSEHIVWLKSGEKWFVVTVSEPSECRERADIIAKAFRALLETDKGSKPHSRTSGMSSQEKRRLESGNHPVAQEKMNHGAVAKSGGTTIWLFDRCLSGRIDAQTSTLLLELRVPMWPNTSCQKRCVDQRNQAFMW